MTEVPAEQPRFRDKGILWKLLLGSIPILLLGAALWAVAFHVLSKRGTESRQVLKLANVLRVQGLEMSELANTFLANLEGDPSFYSAGRNEHVQEHAEHLAIFRDNLNELSGILSGDERAESERLRKLLADYEIRFKELVEGSRELGFGQFGIEGKWNAIADTIRERILGMRDAGLEMAFLKLTRDEQDYIYSDDPKFVDRIRGRLDDLTERLKSRRGGDASFILKRVEEWKKVFESYVTLNTKLGFSEKTGLRAAVSDLYESMEPSIIKIAKLAEDEMDLRNSQQISIGYWVFGLIILFEFLARFLIARSISNPIRKLSEAVASVRDGDLSVEIAVQSRDEVGVLAKAFRDMVQNLSRTQQQLLQSQKLEAVGTLAGGIAHDFNNLLSGILAYAEILKKRHSGDQKTVRDLTTIEKSAERGAELTRQLLGYARKGSYEKRKFDLNETLLEARKLLYRTVDKTISIKADLSQELDWIEGDSGQILQALLNLGINARDAMADGGEFWIESQNFVVDEAIAKLHPELEKGRYVRVSASDTGVGIPKEVQTKIFDPFFTTKEVGKGTGLGLSMVFGIMHHHGGLVTVYSEPGKGARFHLYFPSAGRRIAEVPSSGAQAEAPPSPSQQRLAGKMILVADDEALMRDIAKDILEPEGATLFFATNGEEALQFLDKNLSILDLVILDVIMPKMDGIKAFKELRKMAPNLPVVFSSGYAESDQIAHLRKEAGAGFIQKPYRTENLVTTILKQIPGNAAEEKAA